MQPCKTGDQPYSDASPYSECSLHDFNVCIEACSLYVYATIYVGAIDRVVAFESQLESLCYIIIFANSVVL